MTKTVETYFARIGELNDGYEDFKGKHDRKNVEAYAEHLSREGKRLSEIINAQNKALSLLIESSQAEKLKLLLKDPKIRAQMGTRDADDEEEEVTCNVTCDTCWVDIDGCGAVCTNNVFG